MEEENKCRIRIVVSDEKGVLGEGRPSCDVVVSGKSHTAVKCSPYNEQRKDSQRHKCGFQPQNFLCYCVVLCFLQDLFMELVESVLW